MGLWSEQILPRCTDVVLGPGDVTRHRRATVAGLTGTVVELGFASGMNLPWYPPEVVKVLAVEPSMVARKRAAQRINDSPIDVVFVGLDGQQLPIVDASVDSALSTFTLCTIPDVDLALHELLRVLKPGGSLHFVEHGLSREPSIATWQHRLNPIEQRLAGGCNLDREIDSIITASGFDITELSNGQLKGPRLAAPWGYLYQGVAVKPTSRAKA
ncbi:MAG: class I SAM-dependent methyltransferase [Candidatus Nanopelagicales bacterium]